MEKETDKKDREIPVFWAAIAVAVAVGFIGVLILGAFILRGFRQREDVPTLAGKVESGPVTTPVAKQTRFNENTSISDSAFPQHLSMESLVQKVAGDLIDEKSAIVTTWAEEGESAPDHAYLVDVIVTEGSKRDRSELIELAYVLLRESFYNFSGPVVSNSIIIRASDIGSAANCAFSIGVGSNSASRFLPRQMPISLEDWFETLKVQSNYADVIRDERELAYAGDPSDVPSCNLVTWKTITEHFSANNVRPSSTEAAAVAGYLSGVDACRQQADTFMADVDPIMYEFITTSNVALSTPSFALSSLIIDLEYMRDDFRNATVPYCIEYSALIVDVGMTSLIEGFLTKSEDLEFDFAQNLMFEQGFESISKGLEQISAFRDGRPTPQYDPLAALDERSAELSEILGYGPTPNPLPPGNFFAAYTPTGDWEISATRVDIAQEIDDGLGGTTRRRATGRYAVVLLTVTNRGNSTTLFFPEASIMLYDNFGNEYEVDEIATDFAERHYGIVDDRYLRPNIHPGDSGRAVAVFDIPVDSRTFFIGNRWSLGEGPVRVQLPLD